MPSQMRPAHTAAVEVVGERTLQEFAAFPEQTLPPLPAYASSVCVDLWCDRSMPALRAAERHNHYIDIELLSGAELPKTRPEFAALCGKLRVAPGKVGALPYAIMEWHSRLVWAFAKHRADPKDERAQAEVFYLASVLSHYTGDAGNPLHTTVHYDGRVPPGGVVLADTPDKIRRKHILGTDVLHCHPPLRLSYDAR